MRVTLHNFQEGSRDPLDGVRVDSSDELCRILDDLQRREPFTLELEGENGYRLTVGIGGPVGCIQYAASDGEPPYLIAVKEQDRAGIDEPSHIFLCGGQATEIPSSRCVPYTVLRSVAAHFLETGTPSEEVFWIEV